MLTAYHVSGFRSLLRARTMDVFLVCRLPIYMPDEEPENVENAFSCGWRSRCKISSIGSISLKTNWTGNSVRSTW